MATRLTTSDRNTMADALVDRADVAAPGFLKIYSGSQPASANNVAAGTLLATFTLGNPAFGSASGGSAALAGTPRVTTGLAVGTAGWFRVTDGNGLTVFDGSITSAGGGGDIELTTTSITAGVTITLTAGSFTMPGG